VKKKSKSWNIKWKKRASGKRKGQKIKSEDGSPIHKENYATRREARKYIRGWLRPFEFDLLEMMCAYPDQQRLLMPRTSVGNEALLRRPEITEEIHTFKSKLIKMGLKDVVEIKFRFNYGEKQRVKNKKEFRPAIKILEVKDLKTKKILRTYALGKDEWDILDQLCWDYLNKLDRTK